ncbi:MAG: ABC transporter permease [archaeon]|nr:ABC transporter permease [archaeon]
MVKIKKKEKRDSKKNKKMTDKEDKDKVESQKTIENHGEQSQISDKSKKEFEKYSKTIKRSIKRYIGLVNKEIKVLINDKFAMLIAFALPALVIVLLGTLGGGLGGLLGGGGGGSSTGSAENFAGRGDIPNEPPILGIIDNDNSDLSTEFIDLAFDYEAEGYCEVIISNNQSELEELLGKGIIKAIVVIPDLFEHNLTIQFPTLITVVFDTINTNALQDAQSIVGLMVDEFKAIKGYMGAFNVVFIVEGVPDTGGLLFVAMPLFFPMILFSIGVLIASQSIVSDIPKDRMVLTPTNRYEMLAAKISALQIIMCFLIGETVGLSMVFGLQILGNVVGFYITLFLIALAGVIWGMLVSSVANTPLMAFQFFIFLFLFMIIALFFLEDPNILNWIPISDGMKLLMNVTLRGEPWTWNIEYYYYLLIEITLLYFFTQIIFNRRKSML